MQVFFCMLTFLTKWGFAGWLWLFLCAKPTGARVNDITLEWDGLSCKQELHTFSLCWANNSVENKIWCILIFSLGLCICLSVIVIPNCCPSCHALLQTACCSIFYDDIILSSFWGDTTWLLARDATIYDARIKNKHIYFLTVINQAHRLEENNV